MEGSSRKVVLSQPTIVGPPDLLDNREPWRFRPHPPMVPLSTREPRREKACIVRNVFHSPIETDPCAFPIAADGEGNRGAGAGCKNANDIVQVA